MNAEHVTNVIASLPIRNVHAIMPAIERAAQLLGPALAEKGLRIVTGSTSPSARRSYARLYLERIGVPVSHDDRHRAAENCLHTWEWPVRSSGYFTPIAQRDIRALVAHWLPREIMAASPSPSRVAT